MSTFFRLETLRYSYLESSTTKNKISSFLSDFLQNIKNWGKKKKTYKKKSPQNRTTIAFLSKLSTLYFSKSFTKATIF